jgi:TPP-dependent trihydroxycyclohexane-1,2-dione (THcHDO) dehydratase
LLAQCSGPARGGLAQVVAAHGAQFGTALLDACELADDACRFGRDARLAFDGSAMYAIQALWSAAQLRLPISFVILKNRRYAALQDFAHVFGYREGEKVEGTELPDIDFVALARGQGCDGVHVEDAAELADALARALAHPRPIVVEVEVA